MSDDPIKIMDEDSVLIAVEVMLRAAVMTMVEAIDTHADIAADLIVVAEELAGRRQELCTAAGVDFVPASELMRPNPIKLDS